MERLTYMLVIGLTCFMCLCTLINPSDSRQFGLGLDPQLSEHQIRDVDGIISVHKRMVKSAGGQPPPAAKPGSDQEQKKEGDNKPEMSTLTTSPNSTTNDTKDSAADKNGEGYAGNFIEGIASQGTLKQMLIVLLSITALAVIYFVYRTIRLRGNRKTRKYGVLTTNSDHLEMAPLDQEEDDEDMTVFEANSRYK